MYIFKIWKRRNRVRFFRYLSMRRKDREVTNIIEILQIIEKAKVLHLALFMLIIWIVLIGAGTLIMVLWDKWRLADTFVCGHGVPIGNFVRPDRHFKGKEQGRIDLTLTWWIVIYQAVNFENFFEKLLTPTQRNSLRYVYR